jgi:hypothetical protein
MIHGRISAQMLRFALPALLIVLVLAGLRGTATIPGWAGQYRDQGIAIGLALEILLGVLLVVLVVRGQRWPPDGPAAARLHTLMTSLLITGLFAIPLTMLFAHPWHIHPARSLPPILRGKRPRINLSFPPLPKPVAGPHIPLMDVLYGLLVVIVLAALGLCLVVLARRTRDDAGDEPGLGDEPDELRVAVESGQAALRDLDDARAAIIACYVAMEGSMATAGAVRAVADTPDELLARAAAAGLVRGEAAARLTALFYEARFSTHPLEHGQRGEAEQALSQIAADLGLTAGAGS